jgi:lipopolysaccharide transport system permease protein
VGRIEEGMTATADKSGQGAAGPAWLRRLGEIAGYRDLVRNLVSRDLKVRYRESFVGFGWSMLNPLLMTAVFYLVFHVFLRSPIPMFPVFLLCGILPWNWCAAGVMGGVGSVVGNAALIKKVYFPRELLPLAIVLSNMVHFLLALPVLLLMMVIFGAPFTGNIVFIPLLMAIQLVFLLGVALFLSCLNVFLRDTSSIMEVLISLWFFITPVFYRVDDVTNEWAGLLFVVNPMASLVTAYRAILYDGQLPSLASLGVTALTSVVVLAAGYLFFSRLSSRFGEEL